MGNSFQNKYSCEESGVSKYSSIITKTKCLETVFLKQMANPSLCFRYTHADAGATTLAELRDIADTCCPAGITPNKHSLQERNGLLIRLQGTFLSLAEHQASHFISFVSLLQLLQR